MVTVNSASTRQFVVLHGTDFLQDHPPTLYGEHDSKLRTNRVMSLWPSNGDSVGMCCLTSLTRRDLDKWIRTTDSIAPFRIAEAAPAGVFPPDPIPEKCTLAFFPTIKNLQNSVRRYLYLPQEAEQLKSGRTSDKQLSKQLLPTKFPGLQESFYC
jgi:hypothetical protein